MTARSSSLQSLCAWFPLLGAYALACVSTTTAAAQGPLVQLRGTVQDSLGAPLAGAEVVVGRRSAVSTAQGTFVMDSLTPGRYSLTVRKIGFIPVRQVLDVPRAGLSGLAFRLHQASTILPTVVVEATRAGIHGVIALAGERPAAGATVSILGPDGREVEADGGGRFGFPDLRPGAYLVRVTLPGWSERRVSVQLRRGEGRELAINLLPTPRPLSRADLPALEDLDRRLKFGLRMERVTAEDLQRRGSTNACDLPQLRAVVGGRNSQVTLIVNGTTVYRSMPVHTLCAWRADEIEMVEFGPSVCSDVTRTVATLLGVWCPRSSRRITTPPRSLSGQTGAMSGGDLGAYVILWERR